MIKSAGLPLLLLPDEALLPLLAMAGLLLIVGLRKLAGVLVSFVLISALSPLFEPVFDALFAAMPAWFVGAFFVVLFLMFFGRFVRDVMVHIVGDLGARLIRVLLKGVVGAVGLLARGVWLLLSTFFGRNF